MTRVTNNQVDAMSIVNELAVSAAMIDLIEVSALTDERKLHHADQIKKSATMILDWLVSELPDQADSLRRRYPEFFAKDSGTPDEAKEGAS
jgi:hypothetical protein